MSDVTPAAFPVAESGTVQSARLRGGLPDVNGFWTNGNFHNYADYALSAQFHAGLEHLLDEGHKRRCAIMCSEAVWWQCHRRIIADYLIAAGETVFHILAGHRIEPAQMTGAAEMGADGSLTYPAAGAATPARP